MAEKIIPPSLSELVELGQERKVQLSDEEKYRSYAEYGCQFAGNYQRVRLQMEDKIRRGEVPEYQCEKPLGHIELVKRSLQETRAKNEARRQEEVSRLFGDSDADLGGNDRNLASRFISVLRTLW
jgi:hypothetical protein